MVTESDLTWLKNNPQEWTNTKMVFEISTAGDKTLLLMALLSRTWLHNTERSTDLYAPLGTVNTPGTYTAEEKYVN